MLPTPSLLTVLTKAMGRGTIAEISSRYTSATFISVGFRVTIFGSSPSGVSMRSPGFQFGLGPVASCLNVLCCCCCCCVEEDLNAVGETNETNLLI